MRENSCPLCGEIILPSVLNLHIQLEKTWHRELKETHPEWFTDKNSSELNEKLKKEYKSRHEKLKEEADGLCNKGDNSRKLDIVDGRELEVEEETF
ncbi:MAG: hypothetical protein IPK14_22485 [Blastocatellia bacterium]|nr:hypothetical protein [Blastocatellia bacterium]MBN8723144.1 hypothetical protein [Acidobacteriota bacterium]